MTGTGQTMSQEIRDLVAFLPELHQQGFTPVKRWHSCNGDGTLCFPWPEYDELVEEISLPHPKTSGRTATMFPRKHG